MTEDLPKDIQQLSEALQLFTTTTEKMEVAYRKLEEQAKALDAELAKKNQALQLTTDYLDSLLESISDGVIAVDADGVITRFNRAGSLILGFERADVVGHDFKAIFDRNFSTVGMPGVSELRSKSGRQVPVREQNSPIADSSGRELGMVKTFQDLSELQALREQVRQVDRLAAVGEMAASVAHEIRNPLGGIRGFASLLAQDTPEEDPRYRLVEKILKGTQTLDRVLNELLEFTRPVTLNMKPSSCTDIVHRTLSFFSFDDERIALHVDLPADVRVLADEDKLQQVVLNMLVNAAQSITESGEIRITATASDQNVSIHIADTGQGMDEEALEQAFSPFFTTKEKGSGLGLAISEKIITAHGGEIRVASTPAKGTQFSIQLARAE